MAEEQTVSTVADTASESTPAAAESVETVENTAPESTPATSAPASEENAFETADDVWGRVGAEEETPAETTTTPEKPVEEAPAKPESPEKSDDDKTDKDPEDEAIEAIFNEKSEAEKEKELSQEELDKLAPEELIERQKNKFAKDWAKRNAEKAEVVKDFQFATKPIEEVAAKLEEVSKERYAELSQHAAHKLVDANPDATFKRAYAVKMLVKDPKWDAATATFPSLDDLINGSFQPAAATSTPTAPAAIPAEISELTKELDESLGFDWRDPAKDGEFLDDRELALAKSLRAIEAVAKTAIAEKKEADQKLEDVVKGQTTNDQEALKADLDTFINEFRSGVSEKILPYIQEQTGLAPSKDDTPEIAAFKKDRMELYTGTEYERSNGLDSQFETFAYNVSSVKKDIETVTERIVDAGLKAKVALRQNKPEEAAKFQAAAADERIPLINLLHMANKEFRAKYIDPHMKLLNQLSTKLATPITEAAARVEIVSNGAGPGSARPPERDYETADDVWGDMVTESEKDEALRANA